MENNTAAPNDDWDKIKAWADKINKSKEEKEKKTTKTISTLKYVILLIVIVVVALGLIYIIYRAYTIPEPIPLGQEVAEMIKLNQDRYYDRRHDSKAGAGLFT